MSRLDCARETIRLLLDGIEADGLFPESWSSYWERYVESNLAQRASRRPVSLLRSSPRMPLTATRPVWLKSPVSSAKTDWMRLQPSMWTGPMSAAKHSRTPSTRGASYAGPPRPRRIEARSSRPRSSMCMSRNATPRVRAANAAATAVALRT